MCVKLIFQSVFVGARNCVPNADVAASVGRDRSPAPPGTLNSVRRCELLSGPRYFCPLICLGSPKRRDLVRFYHVLTCSKYHSAPPKDSPRSPNTILRPTYYLTPKYVTCRTAPHFSDVLSSAPRPPFRVPQDHTHLAPFPADTAPRARAPPPAPSLSVGGARRPSPSLSQPLALVPGRCPPSLPRPPVRPRRRPTSPPTRAASPAAGAGVLGSARPAEGGRAWPPRRPATRRRAGGET